MLVLIIKLIIIIITLKALSINKHLFDSQCTRAKRSCMVEQFKEKQYEYDHAIIYTVQTDKTTHKPKLTEVSIYT